MCDASSTDCESSIQRFVWDGDQMLYEITPGASTVSAAQLESDQPTGERYGVVAYTHAGGIDAPLGIVRMGHPAAIAALIVPHANYRGTYHAGTDASGQMVGCPVTSSCIHVVWPAPYQGAYYQGKAPRGDWIGSLVTGQQDATGLMYRRNRYYNPATGQFTQSDPIGIAGGLNTYGFANGDPASYSDPYGLSAQKCPPICPSNDAAMALIARYGGPNHIVPLKTMEEHTTENFMGLEINAVKRTGFAMSINPQSGGAAVGFKGGIFLTGSGVPSAAVAATFTRGAVDLGSGGFEMNGYVIPWVTSIRVWGNLNTEEGHMQVCVVGACLEQRDFSLNRDNPVNEEVRRNRAGKKEAQEK